MFHVAAGSIKRVMYTSSCAGVWTRRLGIPGHGDLYAAVPLALSEAFFVLNLLACFMHQIFELVDGPYQPVRMNSPPQPLSG